MNRPVLHNDEGGTNINAERKPGERPGPPRFDPDLGAWVLSRHADVLAALRDSRLSATANRSESDPVIVDEAAHSEMRRTARAAMSPEKLAAWRSDLEPPAWEFARKLVPGEPFDLVSEFAGPWSLTAAALVNGVEREDSERLAALAADVFAGADDPYDSDRQARADVAVAELARSVEGPLAVQSFVALCQSLECFLAGAWLALLEWPDQLERLRNQPDLLSNAIDELLRYAGPSRAQFRRAIETVDNAGITLNRGERVILMLAAANRDPAKFPEPDRLDIGRSAAGHLAFGLGTHACAGAPLVRMAASVATSVFVSHFGPAEVLEVQWREGFAIRGPRSLKIVVRI